MTEELEARLSALEAGVRALATHVFTGWVHPNEGGVGKEDEQNQADEDRAWNEDRMDAAAGRLEFEQQRDEHGRWTSGSASALRDEYARAHQDELTKGSGSSSRAAALRQLTPQGRAALTEKDMHKAEVVSNRKVAAEIQAGRSRNGSPGDLRDKAAADNLRSDAKESADYANYASVKAGSAADIHDPEGDAYLQPGWSTAQANFRG